MSTLDSAIQAYLDEARELLADLEEGLLEIEQAPDNRDCVARVFRSMHTLKGSGAMFGFEEIARFTHDVETVLDRVRNGELPVTKELLTLTLRAKDHIHTLLEGPREGTPESRAASDALLVLFKQYLAPQPAVTASQPGVIEPPAAPAPPAEQQTFWVRYRPAPDTFLTGTQPLGLLQELLSLGRGVEVFHGEEVPDLEHYEADKAYGWWDVLLVTSQDENALRDVFIFVEDEGGLEFHLLGKGAVRDADLREMAAVFREHPQADAALLRQELGRRFTDKTRKREKPKTAGTAPAPRMASASAASIRVDANRLDMLVNMVGEMVILQARLSIAAKGLRNPVVTLIAEEMERLTVQMRENTLGMRMLPIGTVYGTLRRMVRDVTDSLGKDVDFITEGGDTELDKTVIDQLKDPLMHILRNALDHGIETPEAREAAGKPRQGTVRLTARHSRGDVLIEIQDDGGGIDPDVVRRKAQEKGLIAPDAVLDRKEAMALLFLPGFSTAKAVTGLSGRGVGMDVVKRSIDAIRGSVDLDSTPGQGTLMSLRLPLTLAIIDGLNVVVGEDSYILPLVSVESCQERFQDGPAPLVQVMDYMDKMIPCVSLRRLLETPGAQPSYERVIVVTVEDMKVGLAVDGVIGRQQAVIKSLSELYDNVDFISGTTVNGHGSISLILDVPQLVRRALRQGEPRTPSD